MEFGGLVSSENALTLACHLRCTTRAELAKGVRRVESRQVLGHRLHPEMTPAVDPALSLADSSKLADEIKGHTHRRLAALEGLHVEVVPSLRPGET